MIRRSRLTLLAAAAGLVLAGVADADSLTTTSGRKLVGPIRKTSAGYVVRTPQGPAFIPLDEVQEVTLDPRPDDPPPAALPPPPRPAADPPPPPDPTPPPDVPPPDPVKLPGDAAVDPPAGPGSLDDRGQTALLGGDFAAARAAFAAALKANPSDTPAARGLGYAALRQGDAPAAAAALEKVLGRTHGPPDRSLVLALSAAWIAARQPMRAVRLAGDHVRDHAKDDPVDLPVLDALGSALGHTTGPATNGPAYADGQRVYDRVLAALESTRPGQKRWGVAWQDAGTVDGARGRIADARRRVLAASDAYDKAAADYKTTYAVSRGDASKLPMWISDAKRMEYVRDADARLPGLAAAKAGAYAALTAAQADLAAVPRPDFHEMTDTSDLDLSITPTPPSRSKPLPAAE